MWPLLLDMTKEESIQNLRNLELEAYSHLVSALRAQGPLNSDKRKLLKDTSEALNINQERYKAEIRRAISDEKLSTIAYHITGQSESLEDWAQEGRRLVPLLPRLAPQTAYSAVADEVADNASESNKQLPSPSNTERKRNIAPQPTPLMIPESSKSLPFRIPEPPKQEETKKRKIPVCSENSSLAQHLLGPAKVSRIQQLYRQKTKAKTKEQQYHHLKYKQDQHSASQQDLVPPRVLHQPIQQQANKFFSPQPPANGPKINVLQNISLHPPTSQIELDPVEQQLTDMGTNPKQPTEFNQNHINLPGCSNENQAPPRPKIITNMKSNISFKQVSASPTTSSPGPSSDLQKTIKMCPSKKSITKTSSGQKLIVVNQSQAVTPSSILQRTLSIPFVKNISVKNFEKFKIVTSNSSPNVHVTSVTNSSNSANSVKHKVVTVRTNPTTKKVIPLSQLQVLNSKGGIKVLPLGGKIVGKSVASTTSSPLYIMNSGNVQAFTKSSMITTNSRIHEVNTEESFASATTSVATASAASSSPNCENGKSSVLEDILKASGVISGEPVRDDYDYLINEYHITDDGEAKDVGDDAEVKSEVSVSENEIIGDEFDKVNGTEELQSAEAEDTYEIKEESIEEDQIMHEECENLDLSKEVVEPDEQHLIKSSSEMLMQTDEDVVVPFSDNLPQAVLQVESSTLNDISEVN